MNLLQSYDIHKWIQQWQLVKELAISAKLHISEESEVITVFSEHENLRNRWDKLSPVPYWPEVLAEHDEVSGVLSWALGHPLGDVAQLVEAAQHAADELSVGLRLRLDIVRHEPLQTAHTNTEGRRSERTHDIRDETWNITRDRYKHK